MSQVYLKQIIFHKHYKERRQIFLAFVCLIHIVDSTSVMSLKMADLIYYTDQFGDVLMKTG